MHVILLSQRKQVTNRIELGIEKLSHGLWLKVIIPYATDHTMTATLQDQRGELLKQVQLISGNNLIDIEALAMKSIQVKIDTPYESLSKVMFID